MIIWLDLETTGLNPKKESILELGMVVTDDLLKVVAQANWCSMFGTMAANSCDEFIRKMHGANGLFAECAESDLLDEDIEQEALEFLGNLGIESGTVQMAGNSIHFDRAFLRQWMPKLEAFFHYRQIDMTTVNELARRWSPELFAARPQAKAHRALPDCYDSISLASYYQRLFL